MKLKLVSFALLVVLLATVAIGCSKSTSTTSTTSTKTTAPSTTATTVTTTSTKTFAKRDWKYQSFTTVDNFAGFVGQAWVDEVKQKTGGQFNITFYPTASLGFSVTTILKALGDGTLEAAELWGPFQSPEVPSLDIMEIPGIVPYDITIRKQVAEAMRPYFEAALKKKNVKLLAIVQAEPRSIYTRIPVKTLADLKGIKLRTTGPVENEVFSALGAIPVTMDWSEVSSAMQQKVLDGFGSTNSATFAQKYYADAKYCFELPWDGATLLMSVNQAKFDSLPADEQKILLDSAKNAEAKGWDRVASDYLTYKQKLIGLGMTYNPAPADAIAAVQQKGLSMRVTYVANAEKAGYPAGEMMKKIDDIVSKK